MRGFIRIVLWLLVGVAGSAGIVIVAILASEAGTPPMVTSGRGVVDTAGWDRGIVVASGTWVTDNTQDTFPIQTTEIRCSREERRCYSALAEITQGNMLFVTADRFEISAWDDKTIAFGTDTAACAAYAYTINRVDGRLTGVRTAKQPPPDGCSSAEQRPVNLDLRDGFELWQTIARQSSAAVQPYVWTALAIWLVFVLTMMLRRRRRRTSFG